MSKKGCAEMKEAFDGLENQVPDRVARALRWLRDPRSRWLRLPLGIVLIGLSFFAFLPVIGLELLPLGLLLIAEDVPFLRKPAAKLMIWLEDAWRELKRWWRSKRPGRDD